MSNSGAKIKAEAVREMAAGDITTSFQTLGSVLTRNYFTLVLTNNTNGDIYVSFDGVTDQFYVPAQSGQIYDAKTNDMYLGTEQLYIRYDSAPGAPAGKFVAGVLYV